MTTASMGWAAQLGTVTESAYGVTPGGGVVENDSYYQETLADGLIVPRDALHS